MSTAVALGGGEFAAGLVRAWRSPVEVVALAVIDSVPGPVERWAIRTLGTNDKPALVIGTIVLSLLIGAGLGLLARRSLRAAATGVGLFGAVGGAATAAQADLSQAPPSLIAAVTGIVALRWLTTTSRRTEPEAPHDISAARRAGTGAQDRRRVLVLGGVAATAAAVLAAGGRALAGRFTIADSRAGIILPPPADPLPPLPPGVDFGIDGLEPFVTPASDFYRIDTALAVPQVELHSWALRITGMVEREMELTFDELLARRLVEADITLTCVSNEIGGDLVASGRWTGVLLRDLLADTGIAADADQILGRSVDDWTCGFPVEAIVDRDAMVAVALNGAPLPAERGFPARLIVPGLYGYVSATKWLSEIEVSRFDAVDQYWVQRGWDARAPIKTQAKISVPAPLARVSVGHVDVAGVAWSQRRGISKVEIRVDDGPWMPTELAASAGVDTWRQWRWRWSPGRPGPYRLTVRATDGDGVVQTEERTTPFPNGASGWMTLLVNVTDHA